MHSGLTEQVGSQLSIDAGRCEDEHAQFRIRSRFGGLMGGRIHRDFLDMSICPGRPVKVGVPLRTPWNWRNGSPTRKPDDSILNSRMVRSCRPVRFLRMEMACLTSP